MTGRPLIAAAIVVGLAGPAAASGTLTCTPADGDADAVGIEMNLAAPPFLMPTWVRFHLGDEGWSTLASDAGASPISIGQAFDDNGGFAVDIYDGELFRPVAHLRTVRAAEAEREVHVGYLRIIGRGVFALTCTEG